MSKLTSIAQILGTNEVAAREFCIQVQKACTGAVPSFQAIANALAQYPELKLKPNELAEQILAPPGHPKPAPKKARARTRSRAVIPSRKRISPSAIARASAIVNASKLSKGERMCGDWTAD